MNGYLAEPHVVSCHASNCYMLMFLSFLFLESGDFISHRRCREYLGRHDQGKLLHILPTSRVTPEHDLQKGEKPWCAPQETAGVSQ